MMGGASMLIAAILTRFVRDVAETRVVDSRQVPDNVLGLKA